MYYKYNNLLNDYFRLQHEYNIYDNENNLIHKYLFNKDTYYDENLDPILHTGEDFCICFKKNYKKIKIKFTTPSTQSPWKWKYKLRNR